MQERHFPKVRKWIYELTTITAGEYSQQNFFPFISQSTSGIMLKSLTMATKSTRFVLVLVLWERGYSALRENTGTYWLLFIFSK